jgi:hypothetical protein
VGLYAGRRGAVTMTIEAKATWRLLKDWRGTKQQTQLCVCTTKEFQRKVFWQECSTFRSPSASNKRLTMGGCTPTMSLTDSTHRRCQNG